MAIRKSMANVLLDSTMHSSTTSSSPLRRKSVLPQKATNSSFSENDDEAERLARRCEITDIAVPVNSTTSNNKRRSSLGLGFLVHMPVSQMAERISQCIKLGTENKINSKNAFSLEIIDFMTYMIKKKDVSMSNLQVASTSLDVSTKIYGFRVDGVYMDTLKMIGGLEKQDKDNERQSNVEEMDCQEGSESQDKQLQEKKKKKRNKQRIFNTVEALKINVETDKPSLITMEADLQTTDVLHQVMLPNHANSMFYPHPYNDILVDTVNTKGMQDKDIVCNIPKIDGISDMEICPPLFYFDFHSWNASDELDEDKPEHNNESIYQFDLDASLPHEDEHASSRMNCFDIDVTEEENVNKCAMVPNQVENIVDFQKVLTSTSSKDSEYSFIQKNFNVHWAGPSHWKVTNFKNGLLHTKIGDQVHCQPQAKRKKEIEFCYDGEIIKNVNAKFLPSRSVKLQARTAKIEWNEEILTLPPDKHYDIMQISKLYLHTVTFKYPKIKDATNVTSSFNDMGNDNYDMTYQIDTSNSCPNLQDRVHQENEKNDAIDNGNRFEDEGMLETQIPFTGDNLVAVPKLTNKSSIAYSVQPKKIDMRQLKYSIWKCLKTKTDENIQEPLIQNTLEKDTDDKMNDSKHFSDIYKTLPSILSKINSQALSFPISFVSLLHLANEKTLKISSFCDLTDLIIEQD